MGQNKVSVRIGGPAGAGIMQAGLLFSKACARIGLYVFDYIEYPSLVRGGHNTYQIRVEDEPIQSQIHHVDFLIALDEPTVRLHADELDDESIIIYDEKVVHPAGVRGKYCPVPLRSLAAKADGSELMQNTVALGAALGILGYPFEVFAGVIKDIFKEKQASIIEQNIAAAREGYAFAREKYGEWSIHSLTPIDREEQMVLTGNEAIALGAVKAGLKFYSAYPMTPASSILHTLASWQERHGIVVKQTEDEISAINMAIGAGYAGVRAMVGTSGGGFALMQEGISLAGMTETPVVIVEVQRAGPATGLPTFTEQGDLHFVLHAGHGDFPKIVLAPGDVEEAFFLTLEAFNLAEKYQLPVIILSDKYLGESHKSVPFFTTDYRVDRGKLLRKAPEGYHRYALTEDGVSPRTIPGVPHGFFVANSDEHEPDGWSSEEIQNRKAQMEKRMRKLAIFVPPPTVYGDEEADLTIVTWGSMKGPCRDALQWLRKDGYKVNLLHFTWLHPFPDGVKELLAPKTLLVENNYTGQLGALIREKTGILLGERLLRYDGRPVYPEEVYQRVADMLGKA